MMVKAFHFDLTWHNLKFKLISISFQHQSAPPSLLRDQQKEIGPPHQLGQLPPLNVLLTISTLEVKY